MAHDALANEILEEVSRFYDAGKGLRGTKLKNYTSGDGDAIGFEGLISLLVAKAVSHFCLDELVEISNAYFLPDPEVDEDADNCDRQRMDQHIWVSGKVPLVIESRAWIDKPFYIQKRGVVRNFMLLPYVKRCLTDDVRFLFATLQADITNKTVLTSDKTMGFGDRVTVVRFSKGHRRARKNYFDWGINEEGVTTFIEYLIDTFGKRSATCLCFPQKVKNFCSPSPLL